MAYLSGGSITWGPSPNITFTAEYEVTRNVSQVTISIRVLTSSVSGYSYFGYYIASSVYLNGAWVAAPIIKDNSPSQWSAFYSDLGTYTVTVSDLSQTVLPVEILFSTNAPRSNISLTFNAILPNLAPSTTSAPTFDIGDNLTVAINRQSPNFYHNLELSAEGTKLASANGVSLSYTFDLAGLADTLYSLCPNAPYAATSLVCKTYNGNTLIGTTTATGQARVTNSNPIFSNFDVKTDNNTQTLTGNANTLIGAYSGITVTIPTANKATAQNGATMTTYNIVNGDQTANKAYSASNAVSATFDAVNALETSVSAIDSRGLKTTVAKRLNQLNYSAPVLATASAQRDNDIDPTVKLTLTGQVFSGSFGAVNNDVTITWRWKRVNAEAWNDGVTTITPTISDTGELTYTGYIKNAANTWHIEQAYDLEINIADKVTSGVPIYCTINVGVPGIYMTKTGDQYSVGIGKKPDTQYTLDVNGTIHDASGAVPSIVEQGTSGVWTYRKWSDGTAECWCVYNFGSATITNEYGYAYYATTAAVTFPVAFTDAPCVIANNSAGNGLVTPQPINVSKTSTAFYLISATSNTLQVKVNILAKGRWQ